MSRRLVSYVHVLGDDGQYHVFGPDDDVPKWALDKMGDHCFEAGDAAGDVPAKSAAKAEWVKYAVSQGAEESTAEAMTKEDLISSRGEGRSDRAVDDAIRR